MTLSGENGDNQSENNLSANMSTIISIQTNPVFKRVSAMSGRLLTLSAMAWSKDLQGRCNNVYKFSCGLDEEKPQKKKASGYIFSRPQLKPEIPCIHSSNTFFDADVRLTWKQSNYRSR